ncbi:phage tail protein [Aerococcaceae bacterium NML191219]|nr:phage tail protein [Aerococcaceae bacterium NML191219]
MTYFIQPIITNKAQSEIANAIANKQPITFTRMVFGSGRHASDVATKTNVVNAIHTLQVAQSLSDGDNVKIVGRLDNSNISQTLTVNEIGIFARVGSRAEFMYMYTSAQTGDVIPPRNEAELIRDYEFNTRISKGSSLSVIYANSDKVYAKQSDFAAVYETIQNLNLTYLTQAVFNAFKQGYDSFKSLVEQHIAKRDNPHSVTKSQVGLGSVENVRQASFTDFDTHKKDDTRHVTSSDRNAWNNKANATHSHAISDVSGLQTQLNNATNHAASRSNPHNVTKSQVGLGYVDNVKQASKADFDTHNSDSTRHITSQERTKWNGKAEGSHTHSVSDVSGLQAHISSANAHIVSRSNPHNVTKTQVGLSNVDNVQQAPKTAFDALKRLFDNYGVNNGSTHAKYLCPAGTDFGNFLKSSAVPFGFSIVRDENTYANCRVIKESANWIFADTLQGNIHKTYQIHNGVSQGWRDLTPSSGSNANGSWLRLPDGTQICYGNILHGYGGSVYTDKKTINYAAGFVTYPSVNLSINLWPQSNHDKRLPGINITETSVNSVTFTVGDNAGGRANSQMYIFYIAIGRWK